MKGRRKMENEQKSNEARLRSISAPLDSLPQMSYRANGKEVASAPIQNADSLVGVLGPVVTPERLLGWSLGIIYLWFGALKLANLSPVLELMWRASPLLAKAPFYNGLALSELVIGALLLAGMWSAWAALTSRCA